MAVLDALKKLAEFGEEFIRYDLKMIGRAPPGSSGALSFS